MQRIRNYRVAFTLSAILVIFLASLITFFLYITELKIDSQIKDEMQTPNQGLISKIGFALGLVILYRIFINAGDLSIILLIGTIVSLLIWLTGKFIKHVRTD